MHEVISGTQGGAPDDRAPMRSEWQSQSSLPALGPALVPLPGAGRSPSAHGGAWHRLRARRSFWLGVCGLLLLATGAIGAPWIAQADPSHSFRDTGLTAGGDPVGPSAEFPLGTDRLGRDYLSRLLHGTRASLMVGLGASIAASVVGFIVGATAALAGTVSLAFRVPFTRMRPGFPLPIEATLMRLTDAVVAFPALLVALALVAAIGPSLGLTTVVIAAFLWTYTARIVYWRVKAIKERPFIEAAHALGVAPMSLAVRHILPHVLPLLVAYAAIGVSAAIMFEATLSYLGIGVPPPGPSWGSMIADHVSHYASDPRLLLLPGGALMLTVLSFNLIGDALRDALDPVLAGR